MKLARLTQQSLFNIDEVIVHQTQPVIRTAEGINYGIGTIRRPTNEASGPAAHCL